MQIFLTEFLGICSKKRLQKPQQPCYFVQRRRALVEKSLLLLLLHFFTLSSKEWGDDGWLLLVGSKKQIFLGRCSFRPRFVFVVLDGFVPFLMAWKFERKKWAHGMEEKKLQIHTGIYLALPHLLWFSHVVNGCSSRTLKIRPWIELWKQVEMRASGRSMRKTRGSTWMSS